MAEKKSSKAPKEQVAVGIGMEVRDIVTGYQGIATSQITFLNHCVRFSVERPVGKKGESSKGEWFDVQQLEVVKEDTPARRLHLGLFVENLGETTNISPPGGDRPDPPSREDYPDRRTSA